MDQLLPIAPGGLGLPYGPRHWRDIVRSDAVEITPPATEPLTIPQVKDQIKLSASVTGRDGWIARTQPAARSLLEGYLNKTLLPTTLEMVFDLFPIERALPLPRPPLISVTTLSYVDTLTGLETTVDPADYVVDTWSQPGRICLKSGKTWPVGVRTPLGGKVRWVAGYTAVSSIPPRYLHALALLIAHFDAHPEAVTSGALAELPLGVDALLGDRLVSFG